MKKFYFNLISGILLTALTGCGNNKANTPTTSTTTIELATLVDNNLLCKELTTSTTTIELATQLQNQKIPRIIGGGEVKDTNAYPWMVALIDAKALSAEKGQFCGGTLIDEKWILTAAHCIVDKNQVLLKDIDNIQILFGTHDLSSGGVLVGIKDYKIHPNYPSQNAQTNDMHDFDIALLELKKPVSLTPLSVASGNKNLIGKNATTIGWGYQYYSNGEYCKKPTKLRQVTVPIISNQECNNIYFGGITENMLCAGVIKKIYKDTAPGDSGSPLVVYDKNNGWALEGITSWGVAPLYGVYTKVSKFRKWILENIKEENKLLADLKPFNKLG